ncbi:MAG TPA: hypothetical protein VGG18_16435 [Granulicella sp.]|jgi:hypothetical protein
MLSLFPCDTYDTQAIYAKAVTALFVNNSNQSADATSAATA